MRPLISPTRRILTAALAASIVGVSADVATGQDSDAAKSPTPRTLTEPAQFFPLGNGPARLDYTETRSWIAEFSPGKPRRSGTAKVRVEHSPESLGSRRVTRVVTSRAGVIRETAFLATTAAGLVECRSGAKDKILVAFPITLGPVLKGKSESIRMFGKTITGRVDRVFALDHDVASGGRTFAEALRFEERTIVEGKPTATDRRWYVRGVGLVKRERRLVSSSDSRIDLELEPACARDLKVEDANPILSEPEQFFPMAEGPKALKYELTFLLVGGEGLETRKATAEVSWTAHKRGGFLRTTRISSEKLPQRQRFRRDRTGVAEVDREGLDEEVLLTFPVKLGELQVTEASLGSEPPTVERIERMAEEVATLEAGPGRAWRDLLKLTRRVKLNGEVSSTLVVYLARRVGPVRKEFYAKGVGGEARVVWRLLSPGPPKLSIRRPEEYFPLKPGRRRFVERVRPRRPSSDDDWLESTVTVTCESARLAGETVVKRTVERADRREHASYLKRSEDGLKWINRTGKTSIFVPFPLSRGQSWRDQPPPIRGKSSLVFRRSWTAAVEAEATVAGHRFRDLLVITETGALQGRIRSTTRRVYARGIGLIREVERDARENRTMRIRERSDLKPPSKPSSCPGCGREFSWNDKFCGGCGRKRS